jgi:hypothetical protein
MLKGVGSAASAVIHSRESQRVSRSCATPCTPPEPPVANAAPVARNAIGVTRRLRSLLRAAMLSRARRQRGRYKKLLSKVDTVELTGTELAHQARATGARGIS